MNRVQAFNTAIIALESSRDRYRIEAASAEKTGAIKTTAARAHKMIDEINSAIHILKCELEARTFFDLPSKVQDEIDR